MSERELLHEIVDRLPDADVKVAVRILEALEEREQPVSRYTLEDAPIDDEDFDSTDIEGVETEPLTPHDEVVARLLR